MRTHTTLSKADKWLPATALPRHYNYVHMCVCVSLVNIPYNVDAVFVAGFFDCRHEKILHKTVYDKFHLNFYK